MVSLSVSDLIVRAGRPVGTPPVLHIPHLEIDDRQRVAVMGPSGSGKSTLLRAIAGIMPYSGSISILGRVVDDLPPHRRRVGFMFQDFALFPHMDVGQNVAYGLRIAGADQAHQRDEIERLLDLVGLDGFGGRRIDNLSGGEQQRVALARTLAVDPDVLLLDEPLGSLDVALRESLLDEIRHIVEQLETTTIYVTHDRTEAFGFAERIIVLEDGAVTADGTPSDLWSQPPSASVARLVGHRNIIDATAIGLGHEGQVVVPASSIVVTEPDEGRLVGHVTDCTFDDGVYLVELRLGTETAAARLVARSTSRITPGSAVGVTFDESRTTRI